MRFRDVQHQSRAIDLLRRALACGRTPHAYLFDGPEGVGKERTALALASRLLCQDESLAADADACEQCNSCRLLASENHPDFHLIHRGLHKMHPDAPVRAGKGLFLAVAVIRHFVIEPAGLKPTQGRRRVFVIRDAERMNEEAQNCLLKTLEEPPGGSVLILVTSSASRLLPTIRSRCQVVPFDLLPTDYVAGELRSRLNLPAGDAQTLATLAGGRLGVALRWHSMGILGALDAVAGAIEGLKSRDVEAFGKSLVELGTELATRQRTGASAADEDDSSDEDEAEPARGAAKTVPTDQLREALKIVLLLVAAVYRDALVVRAGADALARLPRQAATVGRLAKLPLDRLDESIGAVQVAEQMLDRNVAAQLVGERLAAALLGELPATA